MFCTFLMQKIQTWFKKVPSFMGKITKGSRNLGCINRTMLPGLNLSHNICRNLCLMSAAMAFCQFLSHICRIWQHNTSFLLYKGFFQVFHVCSGKRGPEFKAKVSDARFLDVSQSRQSRNFD